MIPNANSGNLVNPKIPYSNFENHENLMIPLEHRETNENHMIPNNNNENHENLKISIPEFRKKKQTIFRCNYNIFKIIKHYDSI